MPARRAPSKPWSEALQVLSAAWSQLATNASPGIVERRRSRASEAASWPHVDGLSREEEVRSMGTLHDVGSRVRALRLSVSARAIETRSEPWRRGLVARGSRPAGYKRGVTRSKGAQVSTTMDSRVRFRRPLDVAPSGVEACRAAPGQPDAAPIVVAVDNSSAATAAVRAAVSLGADLAAPLVFVYVRRGPSAALGEPYYQRRARCRDGIRPPHPE